MNYEMRLDESSNQSFSWGYTGTSLFYLFKDRNTSIERDKEEPELYRVKKMPSGMTAEFGFDIYESGRSKDDRKVTLCPSFTVFKKKKKRWPDDLHETTGKDGLIPLMFAKECMDLLEKHACYTFSTAQTIEIAVGWLDNRRGQLYRKLLEREGYVLKYEYKEYYMVKTLKKDGKIIPKNI